MSTEYPHAAAFDDCPERRVSTTMSIVETDKLLTSPFMNIMGSELRKDIVVTCPKYPDSKILMPDEVFPYVPKHDQAAFVLGCKSCEFAKPTNPDTELVQQLHPAIIESSGQLFIARHYPEAAVNGHKTVKERLRDLTGYEGSSEAIGKGGLYFPDAIAENVDGMHQQAMANLLRSIDNFRNEFSHTSSRDLVEKVTHGVAYSHLNIASLAMRHLDTAVVQPKS